MNNTNNNIPKKEKHWTLRLVNASTEMQSLLKSSAQGFKFKYCPLPDILEKGRNILNEHNLTFFQTMLIKDGCNCLRTVIVDLARATAGIAMPGECDQVLISDIEIPIAEETEKIGTETDKKTGEQTRTKKTFKNHQDAGSGITYYRRYSLMTILNIHPDTDDGGHRGRGREQLFPAQAGMNRPPQASNLYTQHR